MGLRVVRGIVVQAAQSQEYKLGRELWGDPYRQSLCLLSSWPTHPRILSFLNIFITSRCGVRGSVQGTMLPKHSSETLTVFKREVFRVFGSEPGSAGRCLGRCYCPSFVPSLALLPLPTKQSRGLGLGLLWHTMIKESQAHRAGGSRAFVIFVALWFILDTVRRLRPPRRWAGSDTSQEIEPTPCGSLAPEQ